MLCFLQLSTDMFHKFRYEMIADTLGISMAVLISPFYFCKTLFQLQYTSEHGTDWDSEIDKKNN